ncbi:Hypothetical protein A7982_03906 [Minicystis rosea]|nr:Hypothetical protein A7982_03906 [Minicystis rosea]
MLRGSLGCAIALGALPGCAPSPPCDRAWGGHQIDASSKHAVGDPTRAPSLPPRLGDAGALDEDEACTIALWHMAIL